MNYSRYYSVDLLNGEGVRAVLFVSGCSHGCRGCYNQSTWSPDSGEKYTKDLENQIIRDLQDTRIKRDGLSISGGDPLHENNREDILHLILRVKEECPDKSIWLWTGYTFDEIQNNEDKRMSSIIQNLDVLIDGKFEKDLRDSSLKWRGSSNQVIRTFKQ